MKKVVILGNHLVFGVECSLKSHCVHYHSPLDIVALKFKCCNRYFCCYECHEILADHPALCWEISDQKTPAILCGNCHKEETIEEYLANPLHCKNCHALFNPGCKHHRSLYFSF